MLNHESLRPEFLSTPSESGWFLCAVLSQTARTCIQRRPSPSNVITLQNRRSPLWGSGVAAGVEQRGGGAKSWDGSVTPAILMYGFCGGRLDSTLTARVVPCHHRHGRWRAFESPALAPCPTRR